MLRRAMASRAEIDLASYDRLFPSQDVMPRKVFGNLIALPLQGELPRRAAPPCSSTRPRSTLCGPVGVPRRSMPSGARAAANAYWPTVQPIAGRCSRRWRGPKRQAGQAGPDGGRHATFGAGCCRSSGSALPPWLLAQLKHLASLHNPKFYENERLRLSNHADPAADPLLRGGVSTHLRIPRGLLAQAARSGRIGGKPTRARRPPSTTPADARGSADDT